MCESETDSECLSLTAGLSRGQAPRALSHTHTDTDTDLSNIQGRSKARPSVKTHADTHVFREKRTRGREVLEILDRLSLGYRILFLYAVEVKSRSWLSALRFWEIVYI